MKFFTRFTFLIISLIILSCSTNSGIDLSDSKSEKEIKELNKAELNKINFIYNVLINTSEIYSHNLGEVTTNKVYLDKDGHKEAVYDNQGNLVTDDVNKGSYNYFPKIKFPFQHFNFDILIWIKWGNSQKDSSTIEERVNAFSNDFIDGCSTVITNWENNKIIDFNEFEKMKKSDTFTSFLKMIGKKEYKKYKINCIEFFLQILSEKEFDEFNFNGKDTWMTDQKILADFKDNLKKSLIKNLMIEASKQ